MFPATVPRQHFRSQTMVSVHRLKRLPVSNHRKSPCEFSGWVVHTEYLFPSRGSSHYLFPVSVSVGAKNGSGWLNIQIIHIRIRLKCKYKYLYSYSILIWMHPNPTLRTFFYPIPYSYSRNIRSHPYLLVTLNFSNNKQHFT